MTSALRSLLAATFVLLLSVQAQAQICSPVPFTLSNGQVADADEVMANFNSTVDCVNTNAAQNGANSDITSLSGLTTPLSVAQGGTAIYTAAVSSTVANAYTTTSVSPSGYTLAINKTLRFIAPASNTATATINPASLGVTTIYRVTSTAGVQPLAGGEIVSGGIYDLMYNGSQLVLMNPSVADQPGEIKPFFGTTAPAGYLLAFGQAISRTTYAPLFAAIASNCGSGDGVTTFNVCDLRGRALFGTDNMGGSAAGRVTAGVSGITGTTLAAAGGNEAMQQHTHTQDSHNHGTSDPGHSHGVNIPSGSVLVDNTTLTLNVSAVTGAGTTSASNTNLSIVAQTATNQNTGAGSSQNMPPAMIVNWMIRL